MIRQENNRQILLTLEKDRAWSCLLSLNRQKTSKIIRKKNDRKIQNVNKKHFVLFPMSNIYSYSFLLRIDVLQKKEGIIKSVHHFIVIINQNICFVSLQLFTAEIIFIEEIFNHVD